MHRGRTRTAVYGGILHLTFQKGAKRRSSHLPSEFGKCFVQTCFFHFPAVVRMHGHRRLARGIHVLRPKEGSPTRTARSTHHHEWTVTCFGRRVLPPSVTQNREGREGLEEHPEEAEMKKRTNEMKMKWKHRKTIKKSKKESERMKK